MPLHHVPLKVASADKYIISDSLRALFVQSWFGQNHSSGGFAQTDELVASRRSMGTVLPALRPKLVWAGLGLLPASPGMLVHHNRHDATNNGLSSRGAVQ